MPIFVMLWVLFIAFAPSLVDRAMLYHSDSSTVQLFAPSEQRTASGVVIGERPFGQSCLVLVGTAGHVIYNEASRKPYKLTLGSLVGAGSRAAALSPRGDAGVVEFLVPGQCEHNSYRAATVSSGQVTRGQSVFGSGFPVGRSFFHWGKISTPEMFAPNEPNVGPFIVVMYPAAPGNSGGPLFDIYGRVVGVLSGGYMRAPALALFASAAQLRSAAVLLPGWDV